MGKPTKHRPRVARCAFDEPDARCTGILTRINGTPFKVCRRHLAVIVEITKDATKAERARHAKARRIAKRPTIAERTETHARAA